MLAYDKIYSISQALDSPKYLALRACLPSFRFMRIRSRERSLVIDSSFGVEKCISTKSSSFAALKTYSFCDYIFN